jgi:hypothetical protein
MVGERGPFVMFEWAEICHDKLCFSLPAYLLLWLLKILSEIALLCDPNQPMYAMQYFSLKSQLRIVLD